MTGGHPPKTPVAGQLLDIAIRQAGPFARRAIDRKLAGAGLGKRDVERIVRRKGVVKRLAAAALARLATRSVPGAIVASGVLAAGALLGGRESAKSGERSPEAVDDPRD